MRPNRPKMPCRFKQNCRNFKEGKECNFSHQRCSKGRDCENMQTCMFFHQSNQSGFKSDFKKPGKFEKPKNQTECRFGMKCTKRHDGSCGFKHTDNSALQSVDNNKVEPKFEQRPFQNKAEVPCRFAQRCTAFPLGKCPFKHEFSQQPPKMQQRPFQQPQQPKNQQKPQIQKSLFQKLCVHFLSNNNCNGDCQRLHEYSESKSISRIFSIVGCQRQIKKIMVMQPYQQDEQPLYIIVYNKRIAFGQLTNLAKEAGNQNIGSSSLVLKRCYDKDIEFQGQQFQNAWVLKIQQNGQRADILFCKCNYSTKIIVLNRDTFSSMHTSDSIVNVITIGLYLIILFNNGKTYCLEYDFASNTMHSRGEPFVQALTLIKKHHKAFNDEQIAVGATADGLCFINKDLKTHNVKFSQKVKDVNFAQFASIPVVLALTAAGEIHAINLLTFEMTCLLSTGLKSDFEFSCLTLTNQNLFVGIDNFGVIVYHIQRYDKPIGIIGLDTCRWKMECDQRGNLILISENRLGRRDISIFKVRKN